MVSATESESGATDQPRQLREVPFIKYDEQESRKRKKGSRKSGAKVLRGPTRPSAYAFFIHAAPSCLSAVVMGFKAE
jgi:hypothetical protein